MSIRKKVLLIATLPLIVIVLLSSALMKYQYSRLGNQQISVFQSTLYDIKNEAIKNYTELAQTSIEPFYNHPTLTEDEAKSYAKIILGNLSYGEHGYYFAYDFDGNSLVHPKQPYRVGKNWIDLQDTAGNFVIQDLIEITKSGGGYYTYKWDNPATGTEDDKKSYNFALEKWGWFIGTGLYLDEIDAQISQQKKQFSAYINNSLILNALLMLAAILSVFGLSFYMNFHELGQADQDLKKLNQQILNAQEEERARVSRELHDGISQTLVTVKYYFERALLLARNGKNEIDPNIDVCLMDGLDSLLSATRDIRRISHALRPHQLDELGLASAIKSLAVEFEKQTKIRTITKIPKIRETLPISSKTSLFRICQEAFTNVEKHSNASLVEVLITKSEDIVTLMIRDNGTGLKEHKNSSGLGIKNMKERVEALNGKFDFKSNHKGSILTINIPTMYTLN